ncbi:MAG: hypothetical protein GY847_39480 [Proteobacteria bacterium]|nr:hypothetical protein [Pseudomonadota bacterium]
MGEWGDALPPGTLLLRGGNRHHPPGNKGPRGIPQLDRAGAMAQKIATWHAEAGPVMVIGGKWLPPGTRGGIWEDPGSHRK